MQVHPMSRPQAYGERLSKLPEELIIHILESALVLLGPISKINFWEGKCEWPGCLCENSDWDHVPGAEVVNNTLLPWLLAPEPIPRLAQYVFYGSNTFHICDSRSDMEWNFFNSRVWLPPQVARQWIQHLEIEVLLEGATVYPQVYDHAQGLLMLRQMQRAVDGFAKLRTLRLMFESFLATDDNTLEALDRTLRTLEPFHFKTPELVLEACSPYQEGHDDVQEGDLARDERLERVLAKHVSATGPMKRLDEKHANVPIKSVFEDGKL